MQSLQEARKTVPIRSVDSPNAVCETSLCQTMEAVRSSHGWSLMQTLQPDPLDVFL